MSEAHKRQLIGFRSYIFCRVESTQSISLGTESSGRAITPKREHMKQINEIMQGKMVDAKDEDHATGRDAQDSVFDSPSEKEIKEWERQKKKIWARILLKEKKMKEEMMGGSTSTGVSDYTSGYETETTQSSTDPTPTRDTTGKRSLHKSTAKSKTGTRSTFTGRTLRKSSATDHSSEWMNSSGKSSDGDHMSPYRDNQSVPRSVSEVQDKEEINLGDGTEGMDVKGVNKDNSVYLIL